MRVWRVLPVACSWDGVVSTAAGYGMDGPGFKSLCRQEVFFFSTPIQAFSEAHPASYTKSTGALSLGIKWSEFRLDHSLTPF